MDGILSRFMTFDKLIATSLIKLLYWIGIALILLGVVVGAFGGFAQGLTNGLGTLVLAPIGGAIAIIFWRFICEVYIVIFGIYDRLGDIKNAVSKE